MTEADLTSRSMVTVVIPTECLPLLKDFLQTIHGPVAMMYEDGTGRVALERRPPVVRSEVAL